MTPEQFDLATPCSEWDVGQVLNHLVSTCLLGAGLLGDEVPPVDVAPGQLPSVDLVGDDPAGAYVAGTEALLAAGVDEAWARPHQTPFGEMPGPRLAGFTTLDILVHGWDLAKATGQDPTLDPGLAEDVLGFARQALTEQMRGQRIGPEIAVDAAASPTERLVAFLGRTTVTTDAVLRALAEPQRRRILELVRDGELPAGRIAEHFDITPQAVSQHLRVLKDAGVLRERRDGTAPAVRDPAGSDRGARSFLDELWPESLSRLKEMVEGDRRGERRLPSSRPVRIEASSGCRIPVPHTTRTLTCRWTGEWAELRPVPDGALRADVNGIPIPGRVHVVELPHRIAFTWGAAGKRRPLPGIHDRRDQSSLRRDGATPTSSSSWCTVNLPPEARPDHGVGGGTSSIASFSRPADAYPGPDPWAQRRALVIP